MPVITREPKRPGETDKEFVERDAAHWHKVEEAEAKVLRMRQNRLPPVERDKE